MDCGRKSLIFVTLCALVGAQTLVEINHNLNILVSVPSTHIGDTEIESVDWYFQDDNTFLSTIVVVKNKTRCINSSDPRCSSLIKSPAVDVSLLSRSSDGKSFTYSKSINESLYLVIHMDSEVTLTPKIVDGEGDRITVSLDFKYDNDNILQVQPPFDSPTKTPTILRLDITGWLLTEDKGQFTQPGVRRFLKKNVDVLVSVPSAHIGDTEIKPDNVGFKYTIVAQKNETRCINSSDPRCSSLIKAPALDVSLSTRSSDGKSFNYSNSIKQSLWLSINVDPEVSVRPTIVIDGADRITLTLDFKFDRESLESVSFVSRTNDTMFSINGRVLKIIGNGQGNGQSTLRCGPLSVLILLALLPALLLK